MCFVWKKGDMRGQGRCIWELLDKVEGYLPYFWAERRMNIALVHYILLSLFKETILWYLSLRTSEEQK